MPLFPECRTIDSAKHCRCLASCTHISMHTKLTASPYNTVRSHYTNQTAKPCNVLRSKAPKPVRVSFCWALVAFVGRHFLGRCRLELNGIPFLGYTLLYPCLQSLHEHNTPCVDGIDRQSRSTACKAMPSHTTLMVMTNVTVI